MLAAFRFTLAFVTLVAVTAQFFAGLSLPGFDPVNFFSFFTIVSNVFGAAVLLLVASGAVRDAHRRDVLRGAATLCLAIVGVVFSLLLTSEESDILPWVNAIVHYATPVAIVADWCIDPPATTLTRSDVGRWFIVPAIYVAYTLVRGAVVGWYPYPFLNATRIGYGGVGAYVLGIVAFTLLTAWVLVAVGSRLRRRARG